MHSIRLRGPWELYLPGSGEPQRVEMPVTWQTLLALTAQAPLPSPARLLRRFGLPTGIAPTDGLRLVIESSATSCHVELNGQPLGRIAPSQQTSSFDVTGLLATRNELVITLELTRPETGQAESPYPLGEVRLDINPQQE
jgi:hypothetical protein